ncbi:MAG TPA: hypothetical protein P5279_14605 [Anaerohalosphaeraceae bacterium]|jgi:phenylacetate-CoA ligase|nr:hypothetical protein [Anaerohalosphaeraceae bacterium]HRT51717.1 hypothetical protein [Anaerohalosphaeraceae bacterium]HRT88336.1 hypothetical protein [Anaerohalosphaeraceae bacterium]
MDIKTLAQGIGNVLVRRYLGPFWFRRRWLNKTSWLSKEELDAIQLRLLKAIVRHAERYVPYYQMLMRREQFTAADIMSLDDIKRFPTLTKEDVISAGDKILSRAYPKKILRHAFTGGTTGTPLNVYRSPFSIATEHAFVRRQWDWAGLGLHDRCAYVTGRIIAKPDQKCGKLYTYDPFMKELILSTYHLSMETASSYLEVMRRFEVKGLAGYPSAVYLMARICLERGTTMQLRAVLTSSETLTRSMRETISKAFECPVYDFYGSAERVCYIFTCEKGSYHVQPEYGFTELIPVGDTGQCKVVSTGFWNLAMPFIRYELGDLVVPSKEVCACGRAFPVVESIIGRQADVIKTPSGREFGAAILTHLLYGTDHILESQIVQDAIDHICINYVPGKLFGANDLQAFANLVSKHLPSELHVDFRAVEAIERTPAGKIRPVVSLLN